MNNDNELFNLCKEVYKRFPDWDWPATTEKSFNPGTDHNVQFGWMPDAIPLYTSDYLLEKLPPVIFTRTSDGSNLTAILTLWVNGDKTVHVAYMIPFDEQNRGDYAKTADTPLKALLKLVIALDDAGELK